MQNFIQIGSDLGVRGPKTYLGVKTENGQALAWPSIRIGYRCPLHPAIMGVPGVVEQHQQKTKIIPCLAYMRYAFTERLCVQTKSNSDVLCSSEILLKNRLLCA